MFGPGFFWTLGSLSGAASVALGAFGAHGLKSRISDPQRLATWSTAAQYQACFFPLFCFTLRSLYRKKKKKHPELSFSSLSLSLLRISH